MIKPNGKKPSSSASKILQKKSIDGLKLSKTLLNNNASQEGESDNGHDDSIISPLRVLREQKGLSQRFLAKKMGFPRNHWVRLENRPWQHLSLGDLALLSDCFNCKMEDLISHFFNGISNHAVLSRGDTKRPSFTWESLQGIRYASFMENPTDNFIGTVTMVAQRGMSKKETPKGRFIFYFVLDGTLLVTDPSKQHLFKKGDYFFYKDAIDYEILNPHQIQDFVGLLVTFPSFITAKL